MDFFFTGNTYDVSNPCIKGARGDASVEVTKFRNETDSDVVSYGVDYYTGRRATIEQRISGEVTYRKTWKRHSVKEMRSLLLSLRDAGKLILLASHNPLDISLLCDSAFEIDRGMLFPFEITKSQNVVE